MPDVMEVVYDRLQSLTWGFAPPVILNAAAETGLLSYLAEAQARGEPPVSAEETARDLGLHPGVTDKVLRTLVGMDLLTEEAGRYAMTPGATPLFEPGSELDHGPALAHLASLSRRWSEGFGDFLRTGLWERPARSPEGTAAFVEAMRAMALGMASRLDGALPMGDVSDVLDIGGALGTFSIELCLRHPTLGSTLLDLPEVVLLAEEEIARYGLEERITTLAGSYLDPGLALPPCDLALLANVLHQEQAHEAAAMVRRAALAVRPGGHLAILEFLLEKDRCHPLSGALFAVNMRLFGDAYSDQQMAGWMTEAGLVEITRHDLSPSKMLLLGRKPPP